jgi:hypothetical protein
MLSHLHVQLAQRHSLTEDSPESIALKLGWDEYHCEALTSGECCSM